MAAPPLVRSGSHGSPQAHMGSHIFDKLVFPEAEAAPLRKPSVRQDPEPHNAPILTWILGFLCLLLVLALVGLGVGLGIKWNQAEDNVRALQLGNANANFNYSSFFGILEFLPVVKRQDLFRQNELDLDTKFVISNQTTTRVSVFNITQALAAPDCMDSTIFVVCPDANETEDSRSL
jgi:hypothetical protein